MADREGLGDKIATRPVEPESGPKGFYNTGSTILNLAASGKGIRGGWAKGRVVNIVGDGSTGKTLLALECVAHARAQNPDVIVKYDNGEEVMDFNVEAMFGLGADIFLEDPSETVEDFGANFVEQVDAAAGEPIIYILDSLDSLGSEEEISRMMKAAKARLAGKKPKVSDDDDDDGGKKKGSYNLERQKYMNMFFRSYIVNNMKENVLLIIISQVRANIGVTFGEKMTRTGGKALDFYTHQVCWLREKEKMSKQVRGHTRTYGIRVHAKFKRNKVNKPFREAEFIILYDYGVDDLGSMIDWLYGPKARKMEFDGKEFTRATLISHIEDNNLEQQLRKIVEERWNEIEDGFKPDRKDKFQRQSLGG